MHFLLMTATDMQAADASKSELDLLRKTNEGLQRDVKRFEQKEQLEEEVGPPTFLLSFLQTSKSGEDHPKL